MSGKQLTQHLRWVVRDGETVLQQALVSVGDLKLEELLGTRPTLHWVDVPTVEIEEDDEETQPAKEP